MKLTTFKSSLKLIVVTILAISVLSGCKKSDTTTTTTSDHFYDPKVPFGTINVNKTSVMNVLNLAADVSVLDKIKLTWTIPPIYQTLDHKVVIYKRKTPPANFNLVCPKPAADFYSLCPADTVNSASLYLEAEVDGVAFINQGTDSVTGSAEVARDTNYSYWVFMQINGDQWASGVRLNVHSKAKNSEFILPTVQQFWTKERFGYGFSTTTNNGLNSMYTFNFGQASPGDERGGMAFAYSGGVMYVADTNNNRVVIYAQDGYMTCDQYTDEYEKAACLLQYQGAPMTAHNILGQAVGTSAAACGQAYENLNASGGNKNGICEAGETCISGLPNNECLTRPTRVAVINNKLYISDSGNNRIVIYNHLPINGCITDNGSGNSTPRDCTPDKVIGRAGLLDVDVLFDQPVKVVATQIDNKILAGGSFSSMLGKSVKKLANLNTNGTVNTSFNTTTGFNGDVLAMVVQSNDNKIIVGGNFTNALGAAANRLSRVNADGTLDTAFNMLVGFNGSVNALAIDNNGKILVGGNFNTAMNISNKGLARLNADGTLDTTFIMSTGFTNASTATVTAIKVQSDGKILVGGNFTNALGSVITGLARLNSNGTLDSSVNLGLDGSVQTIVLQSDGKILVGGSFVTASATTSSRLVRLNTAGTVDSSFIMTTGFGATVNSVAVQSDGKILVGGEFTNAQGTTANRLVRLTSTGTIDGSFSIGSGFNSSVNSIALRPDGKIIVGGNFSTVQGIATNYIAMLDADGSLSPIYSYPLLGYGKVTLNNPTDVVAKADKLFIADTGNNRLLRIDDFEDTFSFNCTASTWPGPQCEFDGVLGQPDFFFRDTFNSKVAANPNIVLQTGIKDTIHPDNATILKHYFRHPTRIIFTPDDKMLVLAQENIALPNNIGGFSSLRSRVLIFNTNPIADSSSACNPGTFEAGSCDADDVIGQGRFDKLETITTNDAGSYNQLLYGLWSMDDMDLMEVPPAEGASGTTQLLLGVSSSQNDVSFWYNWPDKQANGYPKNAQAVDPQGAQNPNYGTAQGGASALLPDLQSLCSIRIIKELSTIFVNDCGANRVHSIWATDYTSTLPTSGN